MTDIQENSNDTSTQNDKKRRPPSSSNREEITEDNCKFEEGQILKFVKVRFPGHAKSYSFLIGKRNLIYGQKVMGMSDRGMAVGYINSFVYELPFKRHMLPLASINKIATDEDIEKEKETYKKQKEAENICQRLIEKYELSMNLTHVEFTGFGKKVVFYFIAPARVDFRNLVKDLVGELKLRIELRQISVRDRAASQGALGACGRELCCSSFLTKYGNVSIKMAKNQNLTLNYSKLNGVCGQLKCCLQYEDEVYTGKRKNMPEHGQFIKTLTGESGKVIKLNLLGQQFDLLTDKGQIKRFTGDQLVKTYKGDEYKFPHRFDHISDETGKIIGLNDVEARKSRQFERDMEKLTKKAKNDAHETLLEIAEFLPERNRIEDLKIVEEVSNKIEIPLNDIPMEDANLAPVEDEQIAPVKTEQKKPYQKNKNQRNNRNRNRSNNKSNGNKKENS